MKLNKSICTFLAATMFVTALAGCSKTNQATTPSSSNDANTSKTESASSNSEPVTIRWMGHNQQGIVQEANTPVQKLLEERFNVKIEIVAIDIQSPEAVSLFWNSGEKMPNYISNFSSDAKELYKQGLIRTVPKELLYEKMPTWMGKVESLVSKEVVGEQLEFEPGKSYGIPFSNSNWMQSGLMPIRQDWLDKLSLKAPTTLDEMHDVLLAFSKKDPDGNGKNDTYGLHPGQRYNAQYIFGAYGIMKSSFYKDDDNSVWYTSASEPYKQALTTLNTWFKEGIIDPEFVTDDRSAQRKKWSEGKVGCIGDNAYWLSSNLGSKSVAAMVEEVNKDAKVSIFPPVTGPDGKSGAQLDYPGIWGQSAIFFGKDTTDEQIAKIMEIKEALCTDKDLYWRCFYGEEGKEYTMNGETMVMSPTLTAESISKAGVDQYFGRIPALWDDMKIAFADERDILINKSSLEQSFCYYGVSFYAPKANESYDTKMSDVQTIVDKYYYDAITGKVDINATWDKYVKQINSAGLTGIVDEYNAMLK